MNRLTFNILFFLIIQTKITKSGRIGNGKILIKLLSIIADCENDEISKEWNMLKLFDLGANKSAIYKKIDRLTIDFMKTGNRFPSEKIQMQNFEKKVNFKRKTNCEQYKFYLAEMGNFCEGILDKEKAPALILALLEIIKYDNSITTVFYGGEFLPKEKLFGTPAHPKRICIEALLLGLLYQTLKDFSPANAGDVQLLHSKKLLFHLTWLGDEKSPIFWKSTDELQHILDLEISVSVKESLQINQATVKESYPVLIVRKGKEFSPVDDLNWHAKYVELYGSYEEKNAFLFETKNGLYPSLLDFQQGKYIFLYGASAMGKTFLLQHQKGLYLSLVEYENEIRKEFFRDVSCWILVQILLRYHYQSEYETYEICTVSEGKENLWKQLSELLQIFQNSPEDGKPSYTLLLDGMNEISPELQDNFTKELQMICEKWHNVRVVVSGKNYPFQKIFKQFEKVKIEGIPKPVRKTILSDFPQVIEDFELFDTLKIPLFMHYFLNTNCETFPHTQGEILDFYFTSNIEKYDKSIQFVVMYALPFLAQNTDFHSIFKRSEVSDAIEKAVEIYIRHESVWQNIISPKGFRKKALLNAIPEIDFVEILIEQLGILQSVKGCYLQFSNFYLKNYFQAKQIINAVWATFLCYDKQPEQQKQLFESFNLNSIWNSTLDAPYIMLGEICRDYRNIPNESDVFNYYQTELDMLLDIARKFDIGIIANNVIRTMKFSRNSLICGVDFSGLFISGYHMTGVNFNQNGDYPCDFHGCRVLGIPKPDPDSNPFKNCDFRNCNYMFNPETKEKLQKMGAIVD